MKNAIIFHGTGCTPNSYWFPSIKSHLEKLGYEVWIPQLPDADKPDLDKWLPKAMEGKYTEDTTIIGHSAGSPLVLAVLEKLEKPIHRAILVAGYINDPESKIVKREYDWEKIKKSAKDIIIINSDNDPWGCDDKQGLEIWHHIGGTIILREGEGHMGSDKFKQPYTGFPLLERILETKYTRSVIDNSDSI